MTTFSADPATAYTGPDGPVCWPVVMETLARRYPLVPRSIVAREIRMAQESGRLVGMGQDMVIRAIADGNLAAIHEALSQGARLACPEAPGSQGARLPRPDTAGNPRDQAGHGGAARDDPRRAADDRAYHTPLPQATYRETIRLNRVFYPITRITNVPSGEQAGFFGRYQPLTRASAGIPGYTG